VKLSIISSGSTSKSRRQQQWHLLAVAHHQRKQKSSLSACGTNSRHIKELRLTAGEAAMPHEAAAAAP